MMSSFVVLMQGAEGDCTVQNKSTKEVILVPVEVSASIEVDVGAQVAVPPSQQYCYFKNVESGHQLGPVTLTDGAIYVVVDAVVSGAVNVYLGTLDVSGIVQLGVAILVSL